MKAAWMLVASGLVLSACERSLPEVTPEEGERVAQIAEPAATELLRTLVGRLTGALEEGGLSQALELCSTEAIPLTRMVEAGLGGSLSLKRTSFRYRNPDNAPTRGTRKPSFTLNGLFRSKGSLRQASFRERRWGK